jgi:hypothetical protein
MKDLISVDFERSGGYSGIPVRVVLNAKFMNSKESTRMKRLLDKSGILKLQTPEPINKRLADQFYYQITIETKDRKYAIAFNEHQLTPELRLLVRYLQQSAMQLKK